MSSGHSQPWRYRGRRHFVSQVAVFGQRPWKAWEDVVGLDMGNTIDSKSRPPSLPPLRHYPELGTSFPRLSGAAHARSPELLPQAGLWMASF